jgi:hypothetical protein
VSTGAAITKDIQRAAKGRIGDFGRECARTATTGATTRRQAQAAHRAQEGRKPLNRAAFVHALERT